MTISIIKYDSVPVLVICPVLAYFCFPRLTTSGRFKVMLMKNHSLVHTYTELKCSRQTFGLFDLQTKGKIDLCRVFNHYQTVTGLRILTIYYWGLWD